MEIVMKNKVLIKILSITVTLSIIIGGRIFKRYLNYRMNIDNGIYCLYDDQNFKCGEIKTSKINNGDGQYISIEYSNGEKNELLILELIKTEYGHYYYLQKNNSVYVIIKSFEHFLFDVRNEKVQNEYHLFCISESDYNRIIKDMEYDNRVFFAYFKPSLKRTLSLHFGKTKIK